MRHTAVLGILGLLGAAPAAAVPTLSVDMDPATPGIQGELTVQDGDLFAIQILLDSDGLDIAGFSFDLAPGGVLGFPATATAIDVNELFGAAFLETFIAAETLNNGDGEARADASRLLGSAANGPALLLASLTYQARAPGELALDLNDALLVDALGLPIPTFTVADGDLTVLGEPGPVPAPAPLLLVASGLALVCGAKRRSR